MIVGRLLGALLGFAAGGFLGAVLGFIVGSLFDRALSGFRDSDSPEQLQQAQQIFFRTVFTLTGYVAKVDGRVSEEEIAHTEKLMGEWGLGPEKRREAIRLFKEGAASDFNLAETLQAFRDIALRRPQLQQLLLVYLINTALVDGQLDQAEEMVLREVAEALGYSRFAFERLIQMLRAQSSFRGGHYHRQEQSFGGPNELEAAYAALGVSAAASDKEIKKSYRQLMSQYHPDRLMGQGVPDDMLKAATERSQEIQAAYETIKKARKK